MVTRKIFGDAYLNGGWAAAQLIAVMVSTRMHELHQTAHLKMYGRAA
jgi:hypothetical protein